MTRMTINGAACPSCLKESNDLAVIDINIENDEMSFYVICPHCDTEFQITGRYKFISPLTARKVKKEEPTF